MAHGADVAATSRFPRADGAPSMLPRVLAALAALLLAPLAAAQGGAFQDNVTPKNDGLEGSQGPVVGEEESLEDDEGISYGVALTIGVVAFATALGWASWRYTRQFKK